MPGSFRRRTSEAAQPYALTWQLSQGGTVLSTQTTDSFDFAAIAGTYTLTLTVTDAGGDTATASTSVTVVERNSTTEGSWIGTYGAQGYDVIGDAASLPGYVTITPSGQSTWTWAASTTDPRALQNPGGHGRIAAGWYASSGFTVDVDLTDGRMHDLELYFLDWNSTSRSEQVQISNASTGAVLDTETVASFHTGAYLQVGGRREHLDHDHEDGRGNAVLNGLFLDPVSAPTATGRVRRAEQCDGGGLDRDLWGPGLRRHRRRGRPPQLRHHHAFGPVHLDLELGYDRPACASDGQRHRRLGRPAGTRRAASRWTCT